MRHLKAFSALSRRRVSTLALLFTLLLSSGAQAARAQQKASGLDIERGRIMLREIKSDLEKNYYDPNLGGMNLDARIKQAEEKMKTATSNGQIFGIIAQMLIELNDSHTFFIPPQRATRSDYGWQMQMVGDECYVVSVKPGSDAEAKGLKVGDLVLEAGGYGITRDNLWKFQYLYYQLRPQAGIHAIVQSPGAQPRQLELMAKVTQGKRLMDLTQGSDIWTLIREGENEDRLNRHRYYELGDELFIWKMPGFDLDELKVDEMMAKVKKRKALILDLRGNPGGYVKTLERMVGHFFDHDVKIADLKGRKEMKPMLAKTRDNPFKGQVIVLVDSRSASAAEIFARLMQLEKRGTVIGDRTSGSVMQSRGYEYKMGADIVTFYSASVTNADVIMADGKSLERLGVVPDVQMIPKAQDLAGHLDHVLAHAASLAGVNVAPDKAGSMFPIEWRK